MTTTTEIMTSRICDGCGKPAAYEPITFNGSDLRASIKFLCEDCGRALEEAERAEARRKIAERREATWEKTVPAKYRETKLDHAGFNRALWGMLRHHDLSKSVALVGPSGRCKTRVMALLAKRAIAQDLTVGWCAANNFQWAAQREFDKDESADARAWMRTWINCDVLFLDDLGKHKWTDVVESAFFNLLETRSANKRPTHWSMNPDPADMITDATLGSDAIGIMKRALDPSGAASARARFAPIVSRLTDDTLLIAVP